MARKFWPFLRWPNVDVYFSTWDKSAGLNVVKGTPTLDVITEEIVTRYTKITKLNIEKYRTPEDQCNHSSLMVHHWFKVIDMMAESNIHYDGVILIRPDLYIDPEFDMTGFLENIEPDTIYTIHGVPPSRPSVQDQMLGGTMESILKIKLFDTRIETICCADIHLWLYAQIINHGMVVKPIPLNQYSLIRANCRGLKVVNASTISRCAKEWWEKKFKSKYPGQLY